MPLLRRAVQSHQALLLQLVCRLFTEWFLSLVAETKSLLGLDQSYLFQVYASPGSPKRKELGASQVSYRTQGGSC